MEGSMRTLLVVCLLLTSVIAGRAVNEGELLTRADWAMHARDWPAAEKLFAQLTAAAPTKWLYLQGLAEARGNQGKYADAIAGYDKAIALALAANDDKGRTAAG